MPCGVYQHAAAVMGGKIYVTGGDSDEGSMHLVYVYDPQADAWTQLASMSIARESHASAAVGGKLYIYGGLGADGPLSTTEGLDPASGSWAQGSSLTFPREFPVAVAL